MIRLWPSRVNEVKERTPAVAVSAWMQHRISMVDGQCSFYDFLAYFNMEEVIPHTAYKTISGLILDELDHIPQTGEKLHWNRFTLEIVDMDGARIDKILVTPDTIPADENS